MRMCQSGKMSRGKVEEEDEEETIKKEKTL